MKIRRFWQKIYKILVFLSDFFAKTWYLQHRCTVTSVGPAGRTEDTI